MTPALYAKIGGIALLAAVLFGAGFHFGGLKGSEQAAVAKSAQEGQGEAIAQAVTTGLEKQIEKSDAQQINDNAAEAAHGKDVHEIDTSTPRADPVIVYRDRPGKVCVAAVPGAKAAASTVGASPGTGGSVASGGDGVDRRPEIEALKKKLERIAADERLLIAKWPK
jgi:hypothetical protein